MYNNKIDIWSACVILYILLTGNLPNYDDYKFNLDKFEWSRINMTSKEFLKMGLSRDQVNRLDAKDMLNHPWLKDVKVPSYIL